MYTETGLKDIGTSHLCSWIGSSILLQFLFVNWYFKKYSFFQGSRKIENFLPQSEGIWVDTLPALPL